MNALFRRMARRWRQSRGFGSTWWSSLLVVVVGLVSTPAAASSLPVPDAELIQRLVDHGRVPATDERWQCTADSAPPCHCIEYEGPASRFFATVVDASSEQLTARQFLISGERGWLVGQDLSVRSSDDGLHFQFDAGQWHERQSSVTVAVDGATVTESGTGPVIELSGVQWGPRDGAVSEPSSCDAFVDHSPDYLDGEAMTATARSLNFDGHVWRATDFDLADVPGPSIAAELQPGQTSSGFTAPSVYIDPDDVHLSAAYHMSRIPLVLRGHWTAPATAGAGVGVATQSPLCGERRCGYDELALDGLVDADGDVGAELSGDAVVGDALQHISVSSDGIGLGTGEVSTSPALRFRRNGGFQSFNAHRFGASYSGDNHNLVGGGSVVAAGNHSFDLLEEHRNAADVWARYGTSTRLAAGIRGALAMSHREFSSVGEPSGRMMTADLRLDRRFGSPRRMWIRPSMRAGLVAAGTDRSEGLAMESRPRLDVMLDSGLAVQGHFTDTTHHITPRAYVGRRLEADQQFGPSAHLSALEESHHRASDSSYFGGAVIDQRLDFSGTHRLRFPVGMAVVGDAATSQWRPVFHGSLQVDTRIGDRRLQIGGNGLCIGSCRRLGARGVIAADWGPRIQSVHLVEWGHHHRPVVPQLDSRIRSGWTNRIKTTPIAGRPPETLTHMTALRGRFQGWSGQWSIRGRPVAWGELDAGVQLVRYWDALGWGVGVQGAASLDGTDWAALLGVRNSPAF